MQENQLPKTATKKYIRIGLAEKLGVSAVSHDAANSLLTEPCHSRRVYACFIFYYSNDCSWSFVEVLRDLFAWYSSDVPGQHPCCDIHIVILLSSGYVY